MLTKLVDATATNHEIIKKFSNSTRKREVEMILFP